MEQKQLFIDTGRQEFTFTGSDGKSVVVSFNPTDPLFAMRLFETFDDITALTTDSESAVRSEEDPRKAYKRIVEYDEKVREKIDALFNCDFCEQLLPKSESLMNAVAGGAPVWANILMTVADAIDDKMLEEQKLSKARIKKYTGKYRK